MNEHVDCIVAILTPLGRSAVSAIGVMGPSSGPMIDGYFKPSGQYSATTAPAGRILFGHWQRYATGASEEVIVCRKGDECYEVHCHGGRAAPVAIVADLVSQGATEIDWRDWIFRTTSDMIQAEAMCALAEAPTQRCADILLDQYRGALGQALAQINAAIEAEDPGQAEQFLSNLEQRAKLGQHLTRPFRVAVVGAPNVGKSSLVNRLLGYERSIVYDLPGTTRDVVSGITALDGWPVELLDTAGLRETVDPIEAVGTQYARSSADAADLVIYVAEPSNVMNDSVLAHANMLRVLNKIDQAPKGLETFDGCVATCALTGQGIPILAKRIMERLVPNPPEQGAAVPFTKRHRLLVESLLTMVRK